MHHIRFTDCHWLLLDMLYWDCNYWLDFLSNKLSNKSESVLFCTCCSHWIERAEWKVGRQSEKQTVYVCLYYCKPVLANNGYVNRPHWCVVFSHIYCVGICMTFIFSWWAWLFVISCDLMLCIYTCIVTLYLILTWSFFFFFFFCDPYKQHMGLCNELCWSGQLFSCLAWAKTLTFDIFHANVSTNFFWYLPCL